VAKAGRDTILDFSRSQSDKIDLEGIDARTDVANDQAFSFIGNAAFSNQSGELRSQAVNGNLLLYGDVDGDAAADFAIVVGNVSSLKASDFLL